MATLRTGWLLSVLLANLANCFALAGRPVPPSHLSCHIPCNESCNADIHCFWDQPDLQANTNYSLHWESAGGEKSGTSWNGLIHREHFSSHSELRVWVQAKNQYGSENSQPVVFNDTEDIIKPHPPKVILSSQDQLDIEWKSTCEQLQYSVGNCEVRHKTETDQAWLQQDEGGISGTYSLEKLQPSTVYAFQVRCACDTGLMSNWSEILTVKSAESAPIGKVDVWRDCGISPTSWDCILTWKRLPISLACGNILGYEVRLFYNNSTERLLNESATEPMVHLVCDERQCHLNYSLKGVSSVSVSAYNALGATVPSHLALPMPGEEKNDPAIQLEMKEESLNVSWDVPSQLSDSLKEYVVQYKQAGSPLGEGFDWVRVEKSQRTGVFKGQFKKNTPYQVSLFTELHSGKGRYLSSNIVHLDQGCPSRVPSFKLLSSDATHATLFWEPVLMSKQNGVTPYYQIGMDQQNVYNASAYPQHKNRTYELPNLTQGQEYEVWIRAVNGAGAGPSSTIHFKTKPNEASPLPVLAAIIASLIIIALVIVAVVFLRGDNRACPLVLSCLHEKVPDPRNSHIFCQMKHQNNDFLPWNCIPAHEPHPKISLLEVVEIPPWASQSPQEKTSQTDGLTKPLVGDGDNETDNALSEESEATHHKYGREEYSKMVDSDEERDKENEEERADSWSSSEEDLSGYEKHFMPTVLEIL